MLGIIESVKLYSFLVKGESFLGLKEYCMRGRWAPTYNGIKPFK